MLQPAPKYFGVENIPQTGPYLITTNHFSSPGFASWWLTLGINAVVPVDVHWIMTGAMIYPGKWFEAPMRIVTSWAFRRVAEVYGFTNMPPIPPYSEDVEGRASAIRSLLDYAHNASTPVIGMAPEGTDYRGGILGPTPAGLGRFIAHLAPLCGIILPVGVFEDEKRLCVKFGQPYTLQVAHDLPRKQVDAYVSKVVMQAIAKQLPLDLRGEYTE